MRVNVAHEMKSIRIAVDHLYFFTPRKMNDEQLEAFERAAYALADRASELAVELAYQRSVRA